MEHAGPAAAVDRAHARRFQGAPARRASRRCARARARGSRLGDESRARRVVRDPRRRCELSLHREGGPRVSQIVDLDTEELTAWLTRVTQTIDRSLRDTL